MNDQAAKIPEFNYYLWDDGPEFDWALEAKVVQCRLEHYDIRSHDYRCDIDRQIRNKSFWTAHEAACLYFLRDPDKITPEDEESDENDESLEFRGHIHNLERLIVSHQESRNLPSPIFSRDLFLEWADGMAMNCRHIQSALTSPVAAESTSESKVAQLSSADSHQTKLKPQQQRAENNALKVVLALIYKDPRPRRDIVLDVKRGLSRLEREVGDQSFEVGKEFAQQKIDAAFKLIGK